MNARFIINTLVATTATCLLFACSREDKVNSDDASKTEAVEREVTGELYTLGKGNTAIKHAGIKVLVYDRKYIDTRIEGVREISPTAPVGIDDIIKNAKKLEDDSKKIMDGSYIGYSKDQISQVLKMWRKGMGTKQFFMDAKKEWPPASLFFSAFNSPAYETRTNADGKFSVMLPKGDWVIVVDLPLGRSNSYIKGHEYHSYWTIPVNEQTNISLGAHNEVDLESDDWKVEHNSPSVLKTNFGFFPQPR